MVRRNLYVTTIQSWGGPCSFNLIQGSQFSQRRAMDIRMVFDELIESLHQKASLSFEI